MAPGHERIGPLAAVVDRPTTATHPAGSALAQRTLDVAELVWVVAGAARVHAPEGVRRGATLSASAALGPGDVLFVPAQAVHAFDWGSPRAPGAPGAADGPGQAVGCRHGYVHGHLTPGPSPSRAVADARHVVVTASSDDDPLAGLCRYLLWLGLRAPAGWRARAATVAGMVADLVVTGPLPAMAPSGADAPGSALSTVVARWVDVIRERWGAGPPLPPLRVGELAAVLHVAPAHLTRSVRRAYGRAPSTLLEQLRVTRVELLLTGTSSTLETIARLCGYADAFHCSRRFTAAHGMPPGRYRREPVRPTLLDDPAVREIAHRIWSAPPSTDGRPV